MMVANRESFAVASRRLPYDAEIKYLESTGTQYIDTGYIPSATTDVEISFSVTSVQTTQGIFGQRTGALNNSLLLLQYKWNDTAEGWQLRWDRGTGSQNVLSPSAGLRYTGTSTGTQFALNGTTVSVTSTNSGGLALYLFAVNQNGSPILLAPALRIYGCKIYDHGVVICDYVPVRIGTTGYLYNRMSGGLLGNAGTDSFVLGPDKTTWTNPYVTDGLVAMWDAVWNAGPGEHDASATTWKNLVDGSSFGDGASAASYPPVWGADYCRNQAGASGQKQVFSVAAPLAATQAIVCAEEVARAVSKAADVASGWHEIQRFSIGLGFFRGDAPSWGVLGNIVLWPSATQYQPWRTHNDTITPALDPYVRRSYHSSRSGSTPYMRVNNGTKLTMTRGNGATLSVPTTYPLIMSYSCVLEACCIRLYSRELTNDEIAANLAIDRERFNLP